MYLCERESTHTSPALFSDRSSVARHMCFQFMCLCIALCAPVVCVCIINVCSARTVLRRLAVGGSRGFVLVSCRPVAV